MDIYDDLMRYEMSTSEPNITVCDYCNDLITDHNHRHAPKNDMQLDIICSVCLENIFGIAAN